MTEPTGADFIWLRQQAKARKLTNVSDKSLIAFLRKFPKRDEALAALDKVWHGKTYRA